jgi:hypothetical protein
LGAGYYPRPLSLLLATVNTLHHREATSVDLPSFAPHDAAD